MFGFGKKDKNESGKIPSKLADFLEAADIKYMDAFNTRNHMLLKDHFTRECAIHLSVAIREIGCTRNFMTEKVRDTVWTILSENNDTIEIKKEVTYKEFRCWSTTKQKFGVDYSESWLLIKDSDSWKVSKVTFLEGVC